jgi:hypothetical protein
MPEPMQKHREPRGSAQLFYPQLLDLLQAPTFPEFAA